MINILKKSSVNLNLIAAFVVCAAFSSCKEEECDCHRQPDNNYLIFGKFYGMCMGETCVEIFKIEDGILYEDTTDRYPFGNAPYNGIYIGRSSSDYNLVKDIINYVPPQLLNEADTTIGIPDAYDQGGYYLEVKEAGESRFWLIDTDKDNIPTYLQTFTDTLNSYINRLQ